MVVHRRKRAKGPNPLSVLPKKKKPSNNQSGSDSDGAPPGSAAALGKRKRATDAAPLAVDTAADATAGEAMSAHESESEAAGAAGAARKKRRRRGTRGGAKHAKCSGGPAAANDDADGGEAESA